MANIDKALLEDTKKGSEYKKWSNEVKLAEQEQDSFLTRADKVVKRYRDEDLSAKKDDALPARFNILWSNTETLAPLFYSRVPKVEVDRRFKDQDPIGRTACQIWERCTQFAIDNYDFDSVMRAVVKDFQLVARGTAWVRYMPAVMDDGIPYQEVGCDHVHYKDFLHSPAKQWKNVRWVARKIYLSRKQLKARFGDAIGGEVPLDYCSKEDDQSRKTEDQAEFKQACIYELWDSDRMEVVWLSKAYKKGILDKIEDPLGLHEFFPTPKPLFGTTTTETLIPIPSYILYQDQARELDMITMKISLLEDALRCVGWFDATYAKELQGVFNNPRQNEMIPVANWQKLQSAGGMKGVAEWMEIEQIIEALGALYQARDKVKQDLYEITGIADIIRGSTSPYETASAQQIKGQFATTRISNPQQDVQRYARDLIALQGEIIAEHFEPEIMAQMSNFSLTDPQQMQLFYQAIDLLKNDPMRSFRVSIETDSMIAIDEQLDKQRTNEFVQTMGTFLEGSMKALQMAPVLAPMMGETMMYLVRRYKAGRALEGSIEQAVQGLTQMAQQALQQPEKPDPEMMKVQGQIQLEQAKQQSHMQIEQQRSQNDLTLKQSEMAQKAQVHQIESESRMQIEREKMAQQAILQREKFEQDMILEREKMALDHGYKIKELETKDKTERGKALLDAKLEKTAVLPDGTVTTHPVIVKEGTFDFDPVSGKRRVRIIERPVAEVPVESMGE